MKNFGTLNCIYYRGVISGGGSINILMKKITAVFSAAVMLAAMGVSVSADKASDRTNKNIWINERGGWRYILSNGEAAAEKPYKINGVIYDFSYPGYYIGKYTGWIKENDVSRRYSNGVPYTGWVKNREDGAYSYCLDGYRVTGDHQIDNKIYTFDKDGKYTGVSRTPVLTAKCDGVVSTDSDVINLTVIGTDDEKCFGEPYIMERWENGKWAEVEHISVHAVYSTLKRSGGSKSFAFSPQKKFTAGYYRIAFQSWDEDNFEETNENFYAVFEVFPDVTVEMSEESYISDGTNDICVKTVVNINSQKLAEYYSVHTGEIGINVMYNNMKNWVSCTTFEQEYEADLYEAGQPLTVIFTNYIPAIDRAAYGRSVVTMGGKKYSSGFFIDRMRAEPWLDEYSLKSKDLTVCFTVYNETDKSQRVDSLIYKFEEFKDGKWTVVPYAPDLERSGYSKEILDKGGKMAVELHLSDHYNVSALSPGKYRAWIDNYGYVYFDLTDKEPDHSLTPYEKLSMDTVKKIELHFSYGLVHEDTAVYTGNDMRLPMTYLRQLRVGETIKDPADWDGGSFWVVIFYKNGSKEKIEFRTYNEIVYKGKPTYCSEYPYRALNDLMIETLDLDKDFYGYRHS